MTRRLLSLALLAALLCAGPALAADDPVPAESVKVPNFWDPRARLERPSLADVGAIRFLVSDDYPPFAFRDRRGMLIGFNVDLAAAICAVLEAQCAIQSRPFDTLNAGLVDGTGNAILAGIDAERAGAAGLIATQAYLKIPGRFVARRDTPFEPGPPAPAAMVGVVCGSAHKAFLDRYFPALRVTCFPNAAFALSALKAKRVGAVFGDALRLAFWMHGEESQDCCSFAGGPYVDDRHFGSGLAIVLKADDRRLRSALDYALREVYRSGAYAEIYLRYFPVSLY